VWWGHPCTSDHKITPGAPSPMVSPDVVCIFWSDCKGCWLCPCTVVGTSVDAAPGSSQSMLGRVSSLTDGGCDAWHRSSSPRLPRLGSL
jgi:hypothetical protein